MNMNPYALFALMEFLVPRRFIAACERVAFRNPGEARLRRGITQIARFEGLTFLWVALRGESSPTGLRGFFGALGLPMVLAPHRMVDVALRIGYANAADIEVRSWVAWATRGLGLLYILVALGVLPREPDD